VLSNGSTGSGCASASAPVSRPPTLSLGFSAIRLHSNCRVDIDSWILAYLRELRTSLQHIREKGMVQECQVSNSKHMISRSPLNQIKRRPPHSHIAAPSRSDQLRSSDICQICSILLDLRNPALAFHANRRVLMGNK
jgi:hypothetical protein